MHRNFGDSKQNKMKVLMIGMDPQLLDPTSETGRRIDFYKTALDKLSVVVLESHGKSYLGKILAFIKAWRVARGFIRKEKFDLISAQDPFATGLIGYFLKLETGMRLQLQIHTGLFTPYFVLESVKNRAYVRLAKFLLPRADCIKVVSYGIRDYIVEELKIDPSKISVLPVYVSLDDYTHSTIRTNLKEKYPQLNFIILMASRLVGQKNIPLAIEAVGELAKKYPSVGLIIVGSGPDEQNLKLLTKNLKLEDNVFFETWTNDLASYYKTADIFLLTSTYEGWARTVVEAGACGLPVVMTSVGVAGELVKDGENGIIVPVGDKDRTMKAIEYLYLHPEIRKSMGEIAKQVIKDISIRDPGEYLRQYKESFSPCQNKKKNK